jgi:hypothetical protein
VKARRAGFTIIEVLVAMGILLFGMTAILGLLTFGAAVSRTALLRTQTASLSEAVIADLEESLFPYKDGEVGEPVAIQRKPLPGQPDVLYSATATQNPESPLEYKVDVEFTWESGGVRRERRFSTILLREIPFGTRMRRIIGKGTIQ